MQNTILPEIPSRMTHVSNILSEALLFKRNSINKRLCDAPFGSSCALTWNTCVASSSLSSFFRVESWPVIWSMAMGQSLSKMEYLIRERSKRSSLNMRGKGIFSKNHAGGKVLISSIDSFYFLQQIVQPQVQTGWKSSASL